MKKLKQLFCNHQYLFFPYEDFYMSIGDEYYQRKSRIYRGSCTKCNKPIDIIKRWSLLEQESAYTKSLEISIEKAYDDWALGNDNDEEFHKGIQNIIHKFKK